MLGYVPRVRLEKQRTHQPVLEQRSRMLEDVYHSHLHDLLPATGHSRGNTATMTQSFTSRPSS